MAGIRDLLPGVAATLLNNYSIVNPINSSNTVTLSTVRILNSTDATFGTVGWQPLQQGTPFCVIWASSVTDSRTTQTNRAWANYRVSGFVAIEHATTPVVVENYNDLANAWMDQARLVIASHMSLHPYSDVLYPTAGDVRWFFLSASLHDMLNNKPFEIMGTRWYGVLFHTEVLLVIPVNYVV